jgi:hypothetical protein
MPCVYVDVTVTLDACNLEIYGSDLSLVINCLGRGFRGLPEYLQRNARIASQSDRPFASNSFPIHQPSYHFNIHSP